MEFTIIKRRAMTLSRSPQYRAFSRAVMDEKSSSPLFPVGEGVVVANDWCIIFLAGDTQAHFQQQLNVLSA